MAEHTLTVRLRAVVDGYERALDSAGRKTEQLASKAERIEHLGAQYENIGGKITRGITLPAIAAGGAALMVAGNFEASLREIQALTGATAAEMQMLEGQAVKLGATTQFSATETANAMSQLIKGGFDVQQTYQALPGVLQLAAAGTLDIASAADIATNVLSGYRLEVEELGRVNDVLAQTANASDTDVRELGEAFKMVGPIAAGAGMPLEATAATLGMLAENGIRGTMAGTALRGIIASLAAPSAEAQSVLDRLGVTVFDTSGRMRPLVDIVDDLNAAGIDTTGVYELFGRETAGSMQALLSSGGPALEKFTELLKQSQGTAQNLADAKMGGFTGAIEELKGALETLAITVGNSGVLAFTTDFAGATTGLVNSISGVPSPMLATAAAIVAVAAATGPAMWAAGKMATMYKPVVAGVQNMVLSLMVAREQFGLARAAGMSTAGSLTSAFGPGAPLLAGLVVLGGMFYLLKRHSDEMAKSHQGSTDSALALAASANIATRELSALNDETQNTVVSTEDWRKANEEAIATILAMDGLGNKQDHLMEIGYTMVLHGVSPEDAVEQVERLARETGVQVPVELNTDNIGEFDSLLAGIESRSRTFTESWSKSLDDGIGRSGVKDLDEISKKAQEAFATDNIAGWAAALGEAEAQLGDFDGAINYLADRSLNDTEIKGLSQRNAENLKGVLQQITSESSKATESQKEQARAILDTAEAMDGGLTPANVRAAASQAAAGYNASTFAERAAAAGVESSTLASEVEALAGEMGTGGVESDEFADALDRMAAKASMATLDIDAAAEAAEAYTKAIENSTSIDDRLSAGLGSGRALKALGEGITGQERLADAAKENAEANEDAATAIDELGDAARRADPKLSALEIRMGALGAAGDAFRRSLENSTAIDDQADAALGLGEAYRSFGKLARSLPKDLDMRGATTGGLRKRQAEAVRGAVALGKASQDYLATLLEMGQGEQFVQEEAARLRSEYEQQLRQVGMNEDQIASYIHMMGLTPEQVSTAIEVSGLEAARFQLDAYLQLLEGRIPDSVATSVVGRIEAGDIQGAAAELAAWAKTNPIKVDIDPKVNSSEVAKKADEIRASLWDLPEVFDPLTAALGHYTDEQQAALDGLMAAGDGIQDYIGRLVAAGTPQEEVTRQAKLLRDELLLQAGMGSEVGKSYDEMSDRAKAYLDLAGLSDWQIESSITLSGDAEAMFRIQAYQQFMSEEIPGEVKTEVLAAIDEGDLQKASNILKLWRALEENKPLWIKAAISNLDQIGNPIGMLEKGHNRDYNGNGVIGMAGGGKVVGPGTSTSDSVLRRLSNDEFVVRAAAAQRLGYDNLAEANASGTWPGTAGALSASDLTSAGAGFSDAAIVAELRDLRAQMSRMKAGYTIGKVELVSPNPRRSAEDLVGRTHAVAQVMGLAD